MLDIMNLVPHSCTNSRSRPSRLHPLKVVLLTRHLAFARDGAPAGRAIGAQDNDAGLDHECEQGSWCRRGCAPGVRAFGGLRRGGRAGEKHDSPRAGHEGQRHGRLPAPIFRRPGQGNPGAGSRLQRGGTAGGTCRQGRRSSQQRRLAGAARSGHFPG